MKYWKWLWIATLLAVVGYSCYDYMQNGFNVERIMQISIVASGGIGFFYKKNK
jgi:hypothetical protein